MTEATTTMTVCRLAALDVGFCHTGRVLPYLMGEYVTSGAPTFTVSVAEDEVEAERLTLSTLDDRREGARHRDYCEALALYRKFCEHLPLYDGFFLHAAFFEAEGHGIAILAPSGVGKSTHLALWRDLLGNRCTVINGDKPLVRIRDGIPYGYGAPLCGKEGWQVNRAVPITDILLLSRGEVDEILPISAAEAFPTLHSAVLAPRDTEALARLLPLTSALVAGAKCYRARVTPRLSAAEAAYRAIFES